jgi:hypothetical protein
LFKKIYWFLFVYDINNSLGGRQVDSSWSFKKKLMRDAACLVLFSYGLLIFNAFIPIAADAVAHTFWEKEHLLTVHKVNGKYHVHVQIVNNAKQSGSDKSSGNLKFGSEDYSHLLFTGHYSFAHSLVTKQSHFTYQSDFPVSHPDKDYPPPRA